MKYRVSVTFRGSFTGDTTKGVIRGFDGTFEANRGTPDFQSDELFSWEIGEAIAQITEDQRGLEADYGDNRVFKVTPVE